MNPKLRGYVLCHATFAQFKGMQCRGAARLSYLFFSNEKCGIEDIWWRSRGNGVFRKTLLFATSSRLLVSFSLGWIYEGRRVEARTRFRKWSVLWTEKWKSGHCPRLAGWKEGRDALLKFATLSVASLRLIKNCAGLCASLYACGQGNCTRVTIKWATISASPPLQ